MTQTPFSVPTFAPTYADVADAAHRLHGIAHIGPGLGRGVRARHCGQLGEAAHEGAVDPVFPAPDPSSGKAQRPA